MSKIFNIHKLREKNENISHSLLRNLGIKVLEYWELNSR